MKPRDVKSDPYAKYSVDSNEKDLKFQVGDHVRASKYKNIFAKRYTSSWSAEVFVISKIKRTVFSAEILYEKELQKTNQDEFRIERVIKSKVIVGLIEKTLNKTSQYFPEPCSHFRRNVKVELDLSNDSTKTDLKNALGIDASNFALKSNKIRFKYWSR